MEKIQTSPVRRFRRFEMEFPCYVWHSRAQEKLEEAPILAETKDGSLGGICFVASADWEVGTEIECEIKLPLEPLAIKSIRCRGKIVRVAKLGNGGLEVGATLEDISYQHPKNDREEE